MLVNKAIGIVAEKCGEKREVYSGEAYLFRIMQAVLFVKDITDDENVHAATALYGVLNELNTEQITEEFGHEITDLLEPLRESSLKTWKDRKNDVLKFLRKEADLRQKAIVLSHELIEINLLYNIYANLSDEAFDRFNEPKESYSEYYFELVNVLEDLDGYSIYSQFTYKINDIFKKSTFWDKLKKFIGFEYYDDTEEWV